MTEHPYDAIIVGSGPVGSAFARTLAESGQRLRILILEAGSQTTTPPGRHVKTLAEARVGTPLNRLAGGADSSNTSPARVAARPGTELLGDGIIAEDGSGLPAAAMSTNVGGMGIHWTCASPRPGEGERVPFISEVEFDELFQEAWRLLHVTQDAFRTAPLGEEVRSVLGAQLNDRLPEGRKVQPMPLGIRVDEHGKRYWTGTDVILGDVLESGAVELRTDTTVVRIVMEGGSAVGVAAVVDGRVTVIRSRVVYVAADSFRTPRLLHVSGVRPRALGHYLNDHPQVMAIARLDDRFIPPGARPAHERAGVVDPLSGVSWIPYDRETFPFHGQIMQLDASPVPLSGVHETWPGSIVGVGLFACKDVRFEDRVEFDDADLDELGLPAIRIHYELTEVDRERLEEARSHARTLAEALGGLLEGREPVVMPNGSSLHYMGTFRMGDVDDDTSVCDSNGAVWRTSGLYVGGNGIIPTPTACNPTATSVAFAIRSARAVLSSELAAIKRQGAPTHVA